MVGLYWSEQIDLFSAGGIIWFLRYGKTLLDAGPQGHGSDMIHLAKMQKAIGPLPQLHLKLSYTSRRRGLEQMVKVETRGSKETYSLAWQRSKVPARVLDNIDGTEPFKVSCLLHHRWLKVRLLTYRRVGDYKKFKRTGS